MINARMVAAELRLWKASWQQVETFLQQIDGARDKDNVHYRRLAGLLRLARAVERHRAGNGLDRPLGDPVIDHLPLRAYRPADGTTEGNVTGWDEKYRVWRLPGTDETELAVAQLQCVDNKALDVVELPGPRSLFQLRGDDGVLRTLRLPDYPGSAGGAIVPAGKPAFVTIAHASCGSLFTREERRTATLAPPGDGTDASPMRSWTTLTRSRRDAPRTGTGDQAVRLSSDLDVDGPPWGTGPANGPAILAAQLAAVLAAAAPSPATVTAARTTAAQLRTAHARLADDVDAAHRAAQDDGLPDPALTAAVGQAAAATGRIRTALNTAVTALDRLTADPASAAARTDLAAARTALAQPIDLPAALFGQTPDAPGSLLGPALDTVIAARVEYPDGSLRTLRALESGFAGTWPAWRRWFVRRHAAVLRPAVDALLTPFVDGLRALLLGGSTGLPVTGLTLGTRAPVGAEQLVLDQPASMVPTLTQMIEPGRVGLLGGPRPAPVVILGIQPQLAQAALQTLPLRLSMAPPGTATGPVGTVDPGTLIGATVPSGLTDRELRRGRSDAGPGHDAIPREALALYGRLALLIGADSVERLLQRLPATATLTKRLVPSPATPGVLTGHVPTGASTLVVHGLGAGFWARPGVDGVPAAADLPEPRLVRPGELVLLRGRGRGDNGSTGPLVQAPVEIDDVIAIPSRTLDRIDTSTVALLSTDPAALPDPPATGGGPTLVCGPDEPLTLIVLKRSWAREALISDVQLSRTWRGFDLPSLAARTLLPLDLVNRIVSPTPVPDEPGVGRAAELAAAMDTLDAWTRYAL